MSITARILLGFMAIALAGVYFLLNPVLDRVERQYLEAAEEPMVDTAEILAGIVGRQIEADGSISSSVVDGFEQAYSRTLNARIYDLLKTQVEMDIYVTDAKGVVIYDSAHPENVGKNLAGKLDVYQTLRGNYGARSTREDEDDSTSSIMCVGAPIIVSGEIAGVLTVTKPQRSMLTFIQSTRRRLIFLAAVGIAAMLVIALLLSRWVTHPLRVLTDHAAALSEGKRPPMPKMPGSHLSVLGDTVEQMRDALANRKYVESYVQTLTHEMKGPVAAIRGAAELLDEDLPSERRHQFTANILSESNRLQNLTDQLLALASLENRKELEAPRRIDLAAVAQRVADHWRSRTIDTGPQITVHHKDPCIVLGEEFLLETAISNLLQNAIDFSPTDGAISIRVDGGSDDQVVVTVEDNGTGFPDYAAERVFNRFYSLPRPASGRKSSGLGLCFVRETSLLHGGDAQIANRTDTSGARATLTFKAAH